MTGLRHWFEGRSLREKRLLLVMAALAVLTLLWGAVIGVGTGMTALVLGATVASRWFSKRRGLVIGLMTASNATGQLVFLPRLAALTEAYGWRTALTLSVAVIAAAARKTRRSIAALGA